MQSSAHGHSSVAEAPTVGGSSVRSGYHQALARTTSTHGTGPSRQRPTLANPEGGGLVRDGPAAKDAGPLPGGREQWYRCCSGQRYQQLSSRLSWWCGECTSSREAAPGYWQLKVGVSA